MKTYVVYHGGCFDGFCAAWAAWRKLGEDDVEYIPVTYGQKAKIDMAQRGRLFILDFCFPRDVMISLFREMEEVVVLDHHETAEQNLEGIPDATMSPMHQVIFDKTKSGGRLAWEYFQAPAPAPWLVDYTEDRDLGRIFDGTSTLCQSHAVNACLRSYPMDFVFWNGLVKTSPLDHQLQGMGILRSQESIVAYHVRRARKLSIDGHVVPVVNATTLQSEIASQLAVGQPFAATYVDHGDEIAFQLRSDAKGLNVAKIAKQYGGGGHPRAAGFSVPNLNKVENEIVAKHNARLVETLMQQVQSLTQNQGGGQ